MSEASKFENSGRQVDASADRLHAEGRIAQQLLGPAWSCVHVFYAVMVDELVLTGVHAGAVYRVPIDGRAWSHVDELAAAIRDGVERLKELPEAA